MKNDFRSDNVLAPMIILWFIGGCGVPLDSHLSVQSNEVKSQISTGVRQQSGEITFIGDGYDVLTGEYKAICFDPEKMGKPIIKNLNTLEHVTVDHATTMEKIKEKLNIDASSKVDVNVGKYGVGGDLKLEFLSKLDITDKSVVLIARASRIYKNIKLASSTIDFAKPYSGHLTSKTESGKRYFRLNCGDEYVHEVDVGGAMYVVYVLHTHTSDESEKLKIANKGRFSFIKIIEANHDVTVTSEWNNLLETYNAHYECFHEGGPAGACDNVKPENIDERTNNFITGVNFENGVIVREVRKPYIPPNPPFGEVTNLFDVFFDYRPFQTQINRWIEAKEKYRAQVKYALDVCWDLYDFIKRKAGDYWERCESKRVKIGKEAFLRLMSNSDVSMASEAAFESEILRCASMYQMDQCRAPQASALESNHPFRIAAELKLASDWLQYFVQNDHPAACSTVPIRW